MTETTVDSAHVVETTAEVTEKQTEGAEKPVVEDAKPVEETEKPVAESEVPVDETKKPVAETEMPTDETKKSVTEAEKPAEVTEKSNEVKEKSAVETEKPADQAEIPAKEVEPKGEQDKHADDTKPNNFYSFTAKNAEGEMIPLSNYKGMVVLVVNVASKCGFTPQYKGLEALYEKFKDRGFTILGFPCNQFGSQEPGTEQEIVDFCHRTYQVSFPIMAKIHVNGHEEEPVYHWMKAQRRSMGLKRVKWNFEKFVIDKEGNCIARHMSLATPEQLETEIEKLLE